MNPSMPATLRSAKTKSPDFATVSEFSERATGPFRAAGSYALKKAMTFFEQL
jgi:hypothetical protein